MSDNTKANSSSLNVGDVLNYDAFDAQGNLLLASGNLITTEFLGSLNQLGIREVYLRRPRYQRDPKLVQPYDPKAETMVNRAYDQTLDTLDELVTSLQSGRATSTIEVEQSVGPVWQQSIRDAAVILAKCIGPKPTTSQWDKRLADRSVRMSMLSVVTAARMGLDEQQCITAGTVAALHDVSLYGKESVVTTDDYLEHPRWSLELLKGTQGMSDEMRVIVGQVHEQCDGSGYPQNLKTFHLHPLSKILNVVDAFLNMTEPIAANRVAFAPADVAAYLAQQAIYGYFDRECVQALLLATGAYPVGTSVQLDDGRIATILRSTGTAYTTPVVQVGEKIEDLRFSPVRILQPIDQQRPLQRIPRWAYDRVLWQE